MSQKKVLFKKLTTSERNSLLEKLIEKKSRVVFWKSIPRYYEAKAIQCDFDKNGRLFLEGPNLYTNLFGERLCLNFIVAGIDYFMQAKVVSQFPENFRIVFELLSDSYRIEKRKADRIKTYPDYNAYVYLKYQIQSTADVIYFNKDEQRNASALHSLDHFQKTKLKTIDKELELVEGDDILGLRVENISSEGVSFFVSRTEYDLIFKGLEGRKFNLTLSLISESYNLEGVELIFKMDYINRNFNGIQMYKVSAKFLFNRRLWEKVEELSLGEKVEYAELLGQFEQFINNNENN